MKTSIFQAAATREGATLLSGAALAAVLGIMLGGSMRPQLVIGDRPMGPQMFATGGGPRSTGPFDQSASYAAYSATLPSYVVGTDYAQAAYVEAPPIAEERVQPVHEEAAPPKPVALTRAAYDEGPVPEVVYPSVRGGAPDHIDPAPPPAAPEVDPPVVTG